MIKLFKILILTVSLFLMNSCAKPTVVSVVMPGDEDLNCKELKDEVAEALNFKRKAEYAKEGTGANTTRVLLFWPAWAKTLHNADVAIVAADDRKYHLEKIMRERKCEVANNSNSETLNISSSSSDVSKQLKELNKLYKSGALTKDEFKDAKEKVLNQ